jgi:hypothetical protein
VKPLYLALFAVLAFAASAYFRAGWSDAFETLGVGIVVCLLWFSFRT